MQKLLKENEVRKMVIQQQLNEEREQDLKACADYARILDQREKERAEYFKVRERKSGDFLQKVVDGVMKGMTDKNVKEAEAIKRFDKEMLEK